ncbi:MAG: MFS transporter [Planctomycetales bacterium]|nr:MFS transporter [Planctomycetales bacterium]
MIRNSVIPDWGSRPATDMLANNLPNSHNLLVRTTPMHPYGPAFWFAYLGNTALMIAVSMMFRYADLVTYLGGTEYELGWIVGVGMCGGMAMRMVQGRGIDRYGSGNIWIASGILVSISLLGHLWIERLDSPLIYVLRIVYMISLAGAFGASITFVSLRAPVHRTGELIGALGSSGFVGMAVGPILVDSLFRQPGSGREQVDRMFVWGASMAAFSVAATVVAQLLSGERRPLKRKSLPTWWILQRYHPGAILFVGVAMGLGIGVPFYFLRPFAQQLGIDGIRGFFFTYAVVAFGVRVMCRRLPDRWGVQRTVTLGMSFLVAELLSFLIVRDGVTLLLPATLGGIAHAFVFPAAMTGGSLAFPTRYRGIATTLMLTMFDLGNLVGQPAVGSLLHVARRFDWPAYPTMFVSVAAFVLVASVLYTSRSR